MGEEERARFEVLLENIQTQVGVIAEGNVTLNHKFDRLERKVDGLVEDVAVLKTDVAVLTTRVGKIERHVGLNGVAKPRTTNRPGARKRRTRS
jgi:hypothetical protein